MALVKSIGKMLRSFVAAFCACASMRDTDFLSALAHSSLYHGYNLRDVGSNFIAVSFCQLSLQEIADTPRSNVNPLFII